MKAKITFFPVGNGDMTLIELADPNETKLLIDINIRQAADNQSVDTYNVAKDLRDRLKRDDKGRPYIEVFLLSHPDKDHCSGLSKHFYLGEIGDYPDDEKEENEKRIIIKEIWSSPIVFRRASKNHVLCDDAKEFNKEARRRVRVNRLNHFGVQDGDRILILGKDINGKTEDLSPILIQSGKSFSLINGAHTNYLECILIAPSEQQDEPTEEMLSKNHSSVILNLKIAESLVERDGCRFLTGGDAEVAIWERLWDGHKHNPDALKYDLLQTPHHCSWHTLSYDSWSTNGEDSKVSQDAYLALSQIRGSGFIVSSSKSILDDNQDPPCIRAKREYESLVKKVGGKFLCTEEYYDRNGQLQPIEFEINQGLALINKQVSASTFIISSQAPRAG